MHLHIFRFFFISVILTSCVPYRRPPPCPTIKHPIYSVIPRHRCQIDPIDFPRWVMWGLFGNDDDGLFGEAEGYRPKDPPNLCKAGRWWLRNPLHNFTFYVIGSAHCQNDEVTLVSLSPHRMKTFNYRKKACTVFPCRCSCFFLGLHGGKPFISMRLVYNHHREGQFYIGWRERGNFGAKCLPFTDRK